MIDLMFAKEFFRTHRETGAIAPSGDGLGRALSRHVRPRHTESRHSDSRHPESRHFESRPEYPAARAVLEVGPGTGTVTRHIARALGPADTLDLVEANPRFVRRLETALVADPALRAVAGRVRLRPGFVQDQELGRYDAIVCGLPFANFDAESTAAILDGLLRTLNPGGTLSFFAYAGVPALRRGLTTGRARARTLGVQAVLARVLTEHQFGQDFVLGNLPPARVHHLSMRSALVPAGR